MRASAKHPVPLRSLIGFQRVSVAASNGSVTVQFELSLDDLELINETGEPRLYSGQHSIIVSRGHGAEAVFNVTV